MLRLKKAIIPVGLALSSGAANANDGSITALHPKVGAALRPSMPFEVQEKF